MLPVCIVFRGEVKIGWLGELNVMRIVFWLAKPLCAVEKTKFVGTLTSEMHIFKHHAVQ